MMDVHKGFQVHLKKDVPSVYVLGCIWHSFSLCASYACAHLPSILESYLRDVCCYLSRSSKRHQQFEIFQDIVHISKHKILKLSHIRWLSRGEVIARVLEQ